MVFDPQVSPEYTAHVRTLKGSGKIPQFLMATACFSHYPKHFLGQKNTTT